MIDELKDEAAKRGGDTEAKADDSDKRKWMSTAQLWLDIDAKSDEVEQATRQRQRANCGPGLGQHGPMKARRALGPCWAYILGGEHDLARPERNSC